SISGDGTIIGPTDGSTVMVVAGSTGSFTLTDNITREGCLGQCMLPVTVLSPKLCVTKLIACRPADGNCANASYSGFARGIKSIEGTATNLPAFCYSIT